MNWLPRSLVKPSFSQAAARSRARSSPANARSAPAAARCRRAGRRCGSIRRCRRTCRPRAAAHAVPPVVELFLDLVLDELALLLDHQDLLQALARTRARPAARAARACRPCRRGGRCRARPLRRCRGRRAPAARRDSDLPVVTMPRRALRRVPDDAVEVVGAAVGERGVDLVVVHARFLLEERVGPADVQAARRQREVLGHHRSARGPDRRSTEAPDSTDVGDALEPDPAARVAAHRAAVQAEVEVVLHVRRVRAPGSGRP